MPTRTFDQSFHDDDIAPPAIPTPRSKRHKKSASLDHNFPGHLTPPYDKPAPAQLIDEPIPFTRQSTPSRNQQALNVIVPIGGIGSRFQKEGYRFPKPLINIVGKPMICWLIEKLTLRAEDTLWVAINEAVDEEFQVGQSLKKWFPKLDARLLRLKYMTKGASETLFIISQSMSPTHLTRPTVSLDCDTIYHTDILSSVRSLPANHGACFYFPDNGPAPIYSYIRTDSSNLITQIAEKRAISDKANSGAYVFPSGAALHEWAAKGLDRKLLGGGTEGEGGEYFTSVLIGEMIASGTVPFLGVEIGARDFSCVGTPLQLREFLKRLRENKDERIRAKRQRFCFDLDMTLVGTPEVPGDYATCPPIWRNIELVRQLHECGHHIIIQTARRMKTHKGNLGAVIADIGRVTLDSLEKFRIPYDDIFFGKPWADVYVDDLAVHANMDTRREIGWMAEDEEAFDNEDTRSETSHLSHLSQAQQQKKVGAKGLVAPRAFNHVQVVGERFIKSSRSDAILGEMFFYSRMPDALTHLFPHVQSIGFEPETATYSVTMDRIKGVTYSHLLVGRSLTPGRFGAFLNALHEMHTAPASSTNTMAVPETLQRKFADSGVSGKGGDVYANYAAKLTSRFETYAEDYRALSPSITPLYHFLLSRLQSYQNGNRAFVAEVIHGDPVFSNAILTDASESVKFFDVRAMQGDTFTLKGDVVYDLAKVYQSLQGYDHVLLSNPEESEGMERSCNRIITPEPETLERRAGGPAHTLGTGSVPGIYLTDDSSPPREAGNGGGKFYLDPTDTRLLTRLREQFWSHVEAKYEGKVRKDDIVLITGSLLFSLIPLHRGELRGMFLEMCRGVLGQLGQN